MPLTDEQIDRYSRQIILPEVGGRGQERLLGACVQVAGGGTVAAWAARYLAAAGIGEVALEPRLAGALRADLASLNPDCRIETELAGRSPLALLAGAGDAAIAGAWREAIPVVLVRLRGAVGELTMLSCSHPSSACPDCAGALRAEDEPADGAANSAAPVVAVLAATEVLKLVLGAGTALCGRRLRCDVTTQVVEDSRLVCRATCTRRAR